MNRVRDAVLKLILDSGRAEQEEVTLDEFCGFVQRFATTVDGSSGLVVDLDPLSVLLLRNFARCDTKRTETFCSVVLWRVERRRKILYGLNLPRDESKSFQCTAGARSNAQE